MNSSYRFHWRSVGSESNPSILFLHGFMGSCDDWRPIADSLVGQFHSVALDLPGHGSTLVDGPETNYRIEHCAAAIIAWMAEKSITHPHCVGYSMGGRVALYLAAKYSEQFSSFVIESGSPGLADESEKALRRKEDERLAERLREESLEHFVGEWYEQPLFATLRTDPQRFVTLVHRRMRNSPYRLAISLRQMGTGVQPSLWDDLPAIDKPLLLIVGDGDSKFKTIAEQMVKRNSQFRIATVDGVGHNVHLEKPGHYTKLLREFFGRQD